MKSKTVTKKEFLRYIKAQRNDRKLDFSNNNKNEECGCPMIHFGKSKLKGVVFAGLHGFIGKDWETIAWFENGFSFDDFHHTDCKNYGELKAALRLDKYP